MAGNKYPITGDLDVGGDVYLNGGDIYSGPAGFGTLTLRSAVRQLKSNSDAFIVTDRNHVDEPKPWNTAWGILDRQLVTSNIGTSSSTTPLTTVNFTAVAGREYEFNWSVEAWASNGAAILQTELKDGGTYLQLTRTPVAGAGSVNGITTIIGFLSIGATELGTGSKSITLRLGERVGYNFDTNQSSINPLVLTVKDVGPEI